MRNNKPPAEDDRLMEMIKEAGDVMSLPLKERFNRCSETGSIPKPRMQSQQYNYLNKETIQH